jgi:hypothetical protein
LHASQTNGLAVWFFALECDFKSETLAKVLEQERQKCSKAIVWGFERMVVVAQISWELLTVLIMMALKY